MAAIAQTSVDVSSLIAADPRPSKEDAGDSHLSRDELAWNSLLRATSGQEFLDSWLALQCRMVPRAKRAVLILPDAVGGRLIPAAHWPERSAPSAILAEAANRAAENHQSVVCRATGAGNGAIGHAFRSGDEWGGVVAIEVGTNSEVELAHAMRLLQWGAVWVERWFAENSAKTQARMRDDAALSLSIVSECLAAGRFETAAMTAVTRLAEVLGCEQVAYGIRRGSGVRLVAVSHCSNFSARSALAGGLERAMIEAIETGAGVMAHRGLTTSEQVAPAHEWLSKRDEIGGRAIVSIPVRCGQGPEGAFNFLFGPEQPADKALLDRLSACARPAGQALARAWEGDQPLLGKLGTKLRASAAEVIGPGHVGSKLAVLGMLAVAALFTVFTLPFRVVADARLEGQIQQSAVAPFPGYIAKAFVRPGDRVKAGDMLAKLDDRDLRLEHHAWTSRREQFARELQRSLSEHKLAAANVFKAQIDEAAAQTALIAHKIERTSITAPFDALVIEGDLSQTLGRAVQQGEVLYTLAPLDAYRVVIEADERDVHFLAQGQGGHVLLMAMPDRTWPIKVTRITSMTSSAKGRNAFRVEAILEQPADSLRPGMEGIAKVEAGSQLAIWIWTRRLVDWARLQIWAWWP